MQKQKFKSKNVSTFNKYGRKRVFDRISNNDIENFFEQNYALIFDFQSRSFKFNKEFIWSKCTYTGMYDVLTNLQKYYGNDIYILCTNFEYNKHVDYGDDIQSGGGGKINLNDNYIEELVKIIAERFHVIIDPTLLSVMSTSTTINENKGKNKGELKNTTIYCARISDCDGVNEENFISKKIGPRDNKYSKQDNNYAGFIFWGTIDECKNIIDKIDKGLESIGNSGEKYKNSEIKSLSVVRIDLALKLMEYANSFINEKLLRIRTII
jgi:hypothetical protein